MYDAPTAKYYTNAAAACCWGCEALMHQTNNYALALTSVTLPCLAHERRGCFQISSAHQAAILLLHKSGVEIRHMSKTVPLHLCAAIYVYTADTLAISIHNYICRILRWRLMYGNCSRLLWVGYCGSTALMLTQQLRSGWSFGHDARGPMDLMETVLNPSSCPPDCAGVWQTID
jgi:hypothetical protein